MNCLRIVWHVIKNIHKKKSIMQNFFSSGRKSQSPAKEKDKKVKEKTPAREQTPVKENIVNAAVDNNQKNKDKKQPAGVTKPYEYEEGDPNFSPSKKGNIKGFRYDEDPKLREKYGDDDKLSPTSESRRATGLAFNYAPGENVKESAEKLKHGELSPRTRDKIQRGELSPKSRDKLLKDGNLSPKTRAKLIGVVPDERDDKSKYVPTKSYSPGSENAGAGNVPAGTEGKYRPISDDPNSRFIQGEKYDPNLSFVPSELKSSTTPAAVPAEQNKKIKVKIMVIVGSVDPKTKKVDAANGEVEHTIGVLDKDTGLIESQYGVIDPKAGTLTTNDGKGQANKRQGSIDAKTGHIHLSEGYIDPKTKTAHPELGQVISIVEEKSPIVEITTITSKVDPNGKVDLVNGDVERTRGVWDVENGYIETKYGLINLKNGEVKTVDAKSGKPLSKQATIDPDNDLITIVGVQDPKTGKTDNTQGHLLSVGNEIDPMVEIVSVVGKLDRKGNLDPKSTVLETSSGQLDVESGKVNTKYGQIDLVKNTITFVDPKTGKTETKDAKVDPTTGQVTLKNQINPKTGKQDKDFARIVSLRIVSNRIDPTGKSLPPQENKDVRFDPKTNQIWVAGEKDPKTGEQVFTSSHVDPKTGYVITIYGYLNPKTNEIEKQVKMDPNVIKVDPVSGQIYSATGDHDESGEPLFSVSEVHKDSGEVYTKVGKVDPKTGRLVIVRVYLVSKRDENGKPQDVDLKTVEFDEKTGRILNVVTNTIYVYKMVDPITGEVVQVDPNDPRISGARTTVTSILTLTGEIDSETGRIKTEYGHIDPNTGDIDPAVS